MAVFLLLATPLLVCLSACRHSRRHLPATARGTAGAVASATADTALLDAVFNSPTRLYSIRVNHAWKSQQLLTQAGLLDYFSLPDAKLSILVETLQPGTTLAAYTQNALAGYQRVQLQGLAQAGSIDVGGGEGELLRAVTYLAPDGQTLAAPAGPNAQPQTFVQALYVAGTHGFSFSMAWPRDGVPDQLPIFRAVLHTFTLAGAS